MKNLNEKFQTLVNGTTGHEFNGICGTNHTDRAAIVNEVYSSLNDVVTANINGLIIELKKYTSVSGKSIDFTAILSNDQYLAIGGYAPKKKGGAYVILQPTGLVEVCNGGNIRFKLDNKKVEFLK